MGRAEVIEDLVNERAIWPVFNVNSCPICAMPRRSWSLRLCQGCAEMRSLHGGALGQFEMVTLSTPREGFENRIREWKDSWGCAVEGPAEKLAREVAAPLSAYLEEHSDSLGIDDDDVVLTWVPSSTELMPRALDRARLDDWFAPLPQRTGEGVEGIPRQRWLDHGRRREKSASEWTVGSKARDRRVVLLDDVYTSGASMHSFAEALRDAGATEVIGVAFIRNISGMVYQEHLAQTAARWQASDRWVGA